MLRPFPEIPSSHHQIIRPWHVSLPSTIPFPHDDHHHHPSRFTQSSPPLVVRPLPALPLSHHRFILPLHLSLRLTLPPPHDDHHHLHLSRFTQSFPLMM